MAVKPPLGHILCIVGARPNFMKIAPIMRAFSQPASGLSARLLHTGQHYDAAMKRAFFDQLHIPEPDIDFEVGSGSHAQQTADIMKRFEPVLDETARRRFWSWAMSIPLLPVPWWRLRRVFLSYTWKRDCVVATGNAGEINVS